MPRMLRQIVDEAGLDRWEFVSSGEVGIESVEFDSHAVRTGSLFCCLRGAHVDGHEFAADAAAAGAAALLVDHRLDLPIAQVVVPDTRAAMGPVAASFV